MSEVEQANGIEGDEEAVEETEELALRRAIEDAPKVSTSGFVPHPRFMFEAGMAFAAPSYPEGDEEAVER